MASSGCKSNAVAPTQKGNTNSSKEKLDCEIRVGRGVSLTMIKMMTLVLMLVVVRGNVEMGMGLGQEQEEEGDPTPKVWPEQFHAVLVFNNTKTSELQLIDLWYDWPNGRNLNLIQYQLGKRLYDVEHNNGTSYFFTRTSNGDEEECRTAHVEVGILRPNWLDGATYLGQRHVDGFLCNVWTKVDFIWYYEDVVSKRPVHWLFYTGRAAHVITFEVGAVLEDSQWQAPAYCFDKHKQQINKSVIDDTHLGARLPLLTPDPVDFE